MVLWEPRNSYPAYSSSAPWRLRQHPQPHAGGHSGVGGNPQGRPPPVLGGAILHPGSVPSAAGKVQGTKVEGL